MKTKIKLSVICVITLFLTQKAIAQDTWQQITPTGDIPSARHGHSMLTIDGIIYLFGGIDNSKIFDLEPITYIAAADNTRYVNAKIPSKSSLDTLHLYSAELLEWTEETPNNSPPPARFNHQAIERNGKMYVFFGMGDNGVLDDIWEYDPDTKLWAQIIPAGAIIPEARSEHTATIYGNIVYIVGGKDQNGNYLSDIWAYRFTNNTWQNCTGISGTSIHGHTAAFYNGNLLLYGGLRNGGILSPEILIYSPGSDSWSSTMPTGDFYPTANAAAVEYQSQLFLFGGYSGTYEPLNFIWDLSSNNFTMLASGQALAGAAAALGHSGARAKIKDTEYIEFVLFGGANDSIIFGDTWIYTSDILIPTGIEENQNTHIHIYPNPATDNIYINLSDKILSKTSCSYHLFDIMGREINTGSINKENQLLDISSIPEGLYFLQICAGSELLKAEKIIKDKNH